MLRLNSCGRVLHLQKKSCIQSCINSVRFASIATNSRSDPLSNKSVSNIPLPSVAYPNPFSHPELFDTALLLNKSDKPDPNQKDRKSPNKSDQGSGNVEKKEREKKDEKIEKNEKKDNEEKSVDIKESINPNSPVSPSSGGISSISNSGNNNGNNNDDGGDDGSKGDKPLVNTKTGLYTPFLAIPMKDRPCLPGRYCTITVTDPEVIRCLQEVVETKEPYFVLFHVRDPNDPDAHIDIIKDKEFVHEIGTLCQIAKVTPLDSTHVHILAYPHRRVKLVDLSTPKVKSENIEQQHDNFPTAYLKKYGISYAAVQPVEDVPFEKNDVEIQALVESIKSLCAGFSPNPLAAESGRKVLNNPSMLADYVGGSVCGDAKQIQEIMDSLDVQKRLEKTLELLKVEVDADEIKRKAHINMRERTEKQYAQMLIKEYTKELLKAAGIGENSKAAKFDERIKHLKMPEEALEAYKTERARLGTQSDMESNVIERYLDWLTSIPFGIYSKDSFNVKKARKILDRDHYGLKDVKDRILEFISVGKVSGNVNGKILCLAGPPGTGKTSIAKSIAESLNRKYTRIAVGGVQDVHDVKGHRRTYVASIPGRIISALVQAKTSNPLMLIDEIDKLDTTSHGGAARAFLEILDPEQNNSFVDNFIEVKVDLSKVLFVCTANYLGNIPAPLRDRMEIIEVNGYTKHEKIEIATRHLIPEACKKVGLEESHVVIPRETISRLIDKYCRESGLRHVKSLINRIFSKASMKIVEQVEENQPEVEESEEIVVSATEATEKNTDSNVNTSESNPEQAAATSNTPEASKAEESGEKNDEGTEKNPSQEELKEEIKKLDLPEGIKIEVTPESLKDFIGPEIYTKDRIYEELKPGVATGLAYNTSGDGDALYIESILTDSIASDVGTGGLHVTGSLKDVMKESASIAYSFAKQFMVNKYPENKFFEAANIHVHCPGGAIPKDGPSAGIAFTSSLISLALNKALPNDTAMTGEITLTGRVLAIGGLREKTLGAKRAGYTKIIFPKDCEYQLEEIPDEVKEGVTYIPVEWYGEVFEHLFNVGEEEGNTVWKEEFDKREQKKKEKKQ
ncbi:PIM1 [Candida metapsilosis]|uniref:Lon protease homolog, mitochondrial n=1 Tax=Candida metapsilosis TaxID=273372 RepID=A0A8H7ZED0_9ASCO|nr:PIM1 [Candida metapsilosis]